MIRSNALGTGWSILSALAGTAGRDRHRRGPRDRDRHPRDGALGRAPGRDLLAAYAPRAISFAAGQAAFTVVLFVLFNMIQPVGWRVGLVRLEDVAIGSRSASGSACSSGHAGRERYSAGTRGRVRPRGRRRRVSARPLIGGATAPRRTAGRGHAPARRRVPAVAERALGDRVRPRGRRGPRRRGSPLLRSARSIAGTRPRADGKSGRRLGTAPRPRVHALHSWYMTLGDALENDRAMPPPHMRDTGGRPDPRGRPRGSRAGTRPSSARSTWSGRASISTGSGGSRRG